MSSKKKQPHLEEAMQEINLLIEQMEGGQLSLEQSLDRFERGVTLIKHCQNILQQAERKVQILLQQNGENQLQPYTNDDE